MNDAPHDHARPGLADQRAVLAVARAVLNADPAAAHEAATMGGACPSCTTVGALQLGFALVAQFTGHKMFVSESLRVQLLAVVDATQQELDSAGN